MFPFPITSTKYLMITFICRHFNICSQKAALAEFPFCNVTNVMIWEPIIVGIITENIVCWVYVIEMQ